MKSSRFPATIAAILLLPLSLAARQPQPKPPLTLDEFFDSVSFAAVKISPSGDAVVIETVRPDWNGSRFRKDLWLYRAGSAGALLPLTQSGHDSNPKWSPDGRWIAFLSDRSAPSQPAGAAAGLPAPETPSQIYLISVDGGEAFPLTALAEDVHAFAWSADSRRIYYAIRQPLATEQEQALKKQWQDVVRYRESERGDVIRSVDVPALSPANGYERTEPAPAPAPSPIVSTPYRVKQLECSPDGRWLAFLTDSRSKREDAIEPYGIYLVGLSSPEGQARQPVNLLGHTEAIFDRFDWADDGRDLFFTFLNGAVEGPYQDAQPRVYWANVERALGSSGATRDFVRWGARFTGAITGYAPLSDGALLAAGRVGTEVQPYLQSSPAARFAEQPGWPGTYEIFSVATHSPRVAFVYSSLDRPAEVYLAPGPGQFAQARPITHFNALFAERALPEGKTFRWTADDGTGVEGMLIYPPGKFGAMHLPMLTLIHGGPEDADGNHFEADWYQWAALAATDGWLVFEPNYRGSIGYGDAFALGIIPHIVSRPGKDILEGVDALVKAGVADPAHLTVGGYSYGGYMTNWLITQTTRFKAAVTGAGAVEHVANWGNDDTSFDDAYFLGGLPWLAEANYNAEAAIWQIGKVRTPTHIVAGSEDIRVYVGENYLLERALHAMGIPCSLLIFPGEGHSLDKNPWHGKIKVREELRWLDRYGKR
jgi:dipeptidyl aminopeptidase/acylaminoacyl peptidase